MKRHHRATLVLFLAGLLSACAKNTNDKNFNGSLLSQDQQNVLNRAIHNLQVGKFANSTSASGSRGFRGLVNEDAPRKGSAGKWGSNVFTGGWPADLWAEITGGSNESVAFPREEAEVDISSEIDSCISATYMIPKTVENFDPTLSNLAQCLDKLLFYDDPMVEHAYDQMDSGMGKKLLYMSDWRGQDLFNSISGGGEGDNAFDLMEKSVFPKKAKNKGKKKSKGKSRRVSGGMPPVVTPTCIASPGSVCPGFDPLNYSLNAQN